MLITSGSSNKPLAKKVANKLGTKLAVVKLTRFANNEARVFVKEKVNGSSAVVIQSLSNPPDEHLVEFCFICDALNRLGATRIIAVIPWLGYSKQDKVFRPGEPLSVKIIAKMLQVVPLDRVVTFDLHNLAIVGFFDLPLINLSARPLFVDYFSKLSKKNLCVVAPDEGAVKSSSQFAHQLGVPIAYLDKKRDLETGKVTIQGISSSVSDKDVIIIDDLIETGATLIKSATFLKTREAAKILVCATHHLFIPGVQEKLETSPIDTLVITDSINKPERIKTVKTKLVSCAGLIAEYLRSLQ